MSLTFLPSTIKYLCAPIDAVIDLTRLGPIQKKTLIRFLYTGIITQRSASAHIAGNMRAARGLGYIRAGKYWFNWVNITHDEDWRLLDVCAATLLLDGKAGLGHSAQIQNIKDRKPTGYLSVSKFIDPIMKAARLACDPEFEDYVKDIAAGKVKTYTYPLWAPNAP